MNQDSIKGLLSSDLVTVTNYKIKQDMDLRKDRWMHYPMQTGLAIYAYNYIERSKNRGKKK